MRDQVTETLVGAIVIAVAALFLTYSLSASGRGGGSGYALHAQFGSVDGLSTGADVRLSGVKVGSVGSIRLNRTTYNAHVDFSVANGVEIPTDSSVRLKNEGLLGGVYLDIQPGGDEEMLEPGSEFEYGQGAIDVLRLLADFVARSDRGSDED